MAGHWTPDTPAHGALNWDTYVLAADAALDNALFDHATENTSAHGGIVADTDSRLSDARTPVLHAASHGSGQPDQITPAAIGAVATALLGAVSGVATLDASGNVGQPPMAHTHQAYTRVRNAGVDMTQRSKLNFVGATVTDDAANDATVITVAGTYTPVDMVLAADQTKTSSTAFTTITGFSFAIEANAVYLLDLCIVYTAGNTGDMNLRISGPTGCTATGCFVGQNAAATNDAAGLKRATILGAVGTTIGPFGGLVSNASVDAQRVRIVNGSTAGTITLDFAQDVSDATSLVIKAGSNGSTVRVA